MPNGVGGNSNLVPLIAAGAQLAGSGINALSQGKINNKGIQYGREMYQRQFQDNIFFWNMQNQYNSPANQVKRLQEAGLSPALMYGGSGNVTAASPVQTPDVQPFSARNPEWGNMLKTAGSAFNDYYDYKIKQATYDNLLAQNTVIHNEGLLRAAQVDNTLAGTMRSKFDLDFDTELRGTSLDYRKESLRQLQTNIDLSINKDAREAALNASSVAEAAQRMLNLAEQRKTMQLGRTFTRADIDRVRADTDRTRENIKLLQQQGVLNDLDIALRKEGISWNDPLWARVVGRFLSNYADPNKPISPDQLKKMLQGGMSAIVKSITDLFTSPASH